MTVVNEHYSALITLLIEVVGEEGDDDELPIREKKKETFSNQNVTRWLCAAARLDCLTRKYAHIMPVLNELHWLIIKEASGFANFIDE